MKKIGFIDYYLSEWHANNYPTWIKNLNKGYEVTHAYAELDISPVDGVSTDEWCEKFGIIRCGSIEELCKSCDVIVILAPSNPEKHLGYAREALKHGKLTYIDKTFAPDLKEAQEIFDIAQKHGTEFFTTSALRYATELEELKGGSHYIITGGGSNFPEYAIHLVELAVVLLGENAIGVKSEARGNQKICTVKCESGRTATLVYSPRMPYTVAFEGDNGKVGYKKLESDFFAGLMADMVRFFESGETSFDSAQTLEVMKIREALIKANDATGEYITL